MGDYDLPIDPLHDTDPDPLALVQRLETKIDELRDREARSTKQKSIRELLKTLQTEYETGLGDKSLSGYKLYDLLSGQCIYRELFEQERGVFILANMVSDEDSDEDSDEESDKDLKRQAIRWAAKILKLHFPTTYFYRQGVRMLSAYTTDTALYPPMR